MITTKKIAALFGIAGVLLALWTVKLSLDKLAAPPVLVTVPEEAAAASEEVMDYLANGVYAAAQTRLYGNPDLGMDRQPKDEAGQLIWEAFTDSMEYRFTSDVYATQNGLARNVEVTTLDFDSVTANLRERSENMLAQRVQQAQDVSQIYDENNEYREDVVMEVLREAVEQSLAEDARTLSREITLQLTYHKGQWWVMPDAALLQVISGNTAG